LLKKNHLDEQYVARRSVRDLPATITSLSDRLSKLTTDQSTLSDHADDPITIGGRRYTREDVTEILGRRLDGLPSNVREPTRISIGTYRGLRFGVVVNPQFPPDVYLEGAVTRQSGLSREHQGPRAVLNNLERLANAYGSECVRVQQDLTIAESQLRDYQARLGKPFTHDAYLAELTNVRDQLKAGLSASSHDSGKEPGPSAAELAEKIKALKSANSIEATPQRARQKHSSAEEPVTTRIRRRVESADDTDTSAMSGGLGSRTATSDSNGPTATTHSTSPDHSNGQAATPPESSVKTQTFQERLAMERDREDLQPSFP
jgi:hypothetical protein